MIKNIPNPKRPPKKYICCKCNHCKAICIFTQDENGEFPQYYRCRSCGWDHTVANAKISSATYKFFRAYYGMKMKFIEMTSPKR